MIRSVADIFERPFFSGLTGAIGVAAAIAAAVATSTAAAITAAVAIALASAAFLVQAYQARRQSRYPWRARRLGFEWDIPHADGSVAICKKLVEASFAQDYVHSLVDEAWGDGRSEWVSTSYGEFVDEYQSGTRSYKLISFREHRRAGDVQELAIERRLYDAFTADEEWIQVEAAASTRELSLQITFPPDRPPIRATITRRLKGTTDVVPDSAFSDVGGRKVLRWHVARPHPRELFTVRWRW